MKRLEDLINMESLLDDVSETNAQQDTDPNDLCPWCDKRMPTKASKTLQRLVLKAKQASYLAPRPSNPFGLKAPFSKYIDVCRRHEYELLELPKAAANGWPRSIRFKDISRRLEGMREHLHKYVMDKSRSKFWIAIARQIKSHGTLATFSLANQYNNVSNQIHAG